MAESVCTRTPAQTTNTRHSATTATEATAASAPREATAIQGVFRAIALALDAASLTDEPHEWSGDSDRLLRIGSFLAERDASRTYDAQEAECSAYDIAALIKATRLVPGDTESSSRTALLAIAEANLAVLTGDADCLETGATRAAASPHEQAAAKPAAIEFDSSAMDAIEARTDEIAALSSCAMCLSAVEAAEESFAGQELASDALPLLNHVIRHLSREAAQAGNQLWEQYTRARAVANGQGGAA